MIGDEWKVPSVEELLRHDVPKYLKGSRGEFDDESLFGINASHVLGGLSERGEESVRKNQLDKLVFERYSEDSHEPSISWDPLVWPRIDIRALRSPASETKLVSQVPVSRRQYDTYSIVVIRK
jgi:hypothetical protein